MALEQTNDAKYAANGTYAGSIDDRFKRTMEVAIGRTESERTYWLSLYPTGTGGLNNIKYEYFGSLGFPGGLQDRENAYWASLSP